jgi:hypothetical protein
MTTNEIGLGGYRSQTQTAARQVMDMHLRRAQRDGGAQSLAPLPGPSLGLPWAAAAV